MQDFFNEILSKHSNDSESQEELFAAILERVEYFLDTQPDLLFSYMYRLDVLEKDLKTVIEGGRKGNLATHFAQLIMKRQILRVETRRKYGDAEDQ